jgi:exopolysaccharide biosynthesis polyprenyl glycosylphosphotransferase
MSVRYSKHLPAFVFFCDCLLLNIILVNSHLLATDLSWEPGEYRLLFLSVNFSWMLISYVCKSFAIKRPLVLSDNINKFLTALIYHLLTVFGIIYFFKVYSIYVPQVLVCYSLFFLLVFVGRSVLFFSLDYFRKRGYNHRQVLIMGDKYIAARLTNSFSQHPEYGYDLTEFIPEDQADQMSEEALESYILSIRPDEVFVCYKQRNPSRLAALIRFGEENAIKIKLVSDLVLNNNYARLVNYDTLPVLQITLQPEISFKIRVLKRSFDILFSSVVMVAGMPVFVILYVVTKASSRGPAFYRQERIGQNEKPFYIYKFRSMYVDAEKFGPQLSRDNDPRITKWGNVMRRTRLDELPQFWNVIKGEMSVVGPRPERQHFIEKIVEKTPDYKKLLRIKPGITSIGQVHYGYAENVDQMCTRMRYDLLYLQNFNLNSDLDIIYKTVKVMLRAKGK